MFTDRSDELPVEPMRAYGVAVAEVEGSLAAFVAGYGEANRLLRGDDAGFVDAVAVARREAAGTSEYGDAAPLADDGAHTLGVAAGDTDGDGAEEIYVHNAGAFAGRSPEPDRLLDPSAHGWADLFDDDRNRRDRNGVSGRSVAVIDRDGSGTYGVAVTGYASPLRLYEGPPGDLQDVAPDLGVDFLGGGRSLVAGPILGDRTDLFYGVERGPNLLLRNDGGFTDFAPERGVSDSHGDARGATLVDVGGELGIACGNWKGHGRLWVPDGRGFRDESPPGLREPGKVRTVVAADFDNDGRQELFCNHFGEPNRLLRRAEPADEAVDESADAIEESADGAAGQRADLEADGPRVEPDGTERSRGLRGGRRASQPGSEATKEDEPDGSEESAWERVEAGPAAEPEGQGTGAAVADLDGDGTLELLVAHGEEVAQPLSLFAVENDGDWVRVLPRTRHGAPARGARVRLATSDGEQVRAIDGGSGYLCQMEPVAHFGLGAAEPVEATVTWPDGESRSVDVAANETVVVEY